MTRKGCFGSGYWSFYVPGRGFVSFSFTQLGLRSTLSGRRFILFAFISAVLPPSFYHPASGFNGVPPEEVRYGIRTHAPFGSCLPIQRQLT